ncbi:hypothetical protein [Streptomyces fradiae]|uniref:hypothetical protein n=1 Tax=Streptomyces fradiae TaxID=1906 RepID=UPI0035BE3C64
MVNDITARERLEPDLTLAELCGASARMVPHWPAARAASPVPVPPSLILGVVVEPSSVRLIAGAPEYGA